MGSSLTPKKGNVFTVKNKATKKKEKKETQLAAFRRFEKSIFYNTEVSTKLHMSSNSGLRNDTKQDMRDNDSQISLLIFHYFTTLYFLLILCLFLTILIIIYVLDIIK
jgi:hypothetical protein